MDDELITERRPVAFPQVFGYLRHITGGLPRHAALVDSLAEYCQRHELHLCGVFTDRDTAGAVCSPTFVGLLDALQLPHTYGALVPALSHLGPKRVATKRKRLISTIDTRLLVIRSSRSTAVPDRFPLPSVTRDVGRCAE